VVRGGRERWLAVACVSAQVAVIAAVVAPSGEAVYKGQATLVVAEPPPSGSALVEAGVVPRGPRSLYLHEVQGIAASGAVVGLVRAEAGGGVDVRVEARPLEGIVRITAEAESTSRAATVANAIAGSARARQAALFREKLEAAIARLERRLGTAPAHGFGTGPRSPDEQRLIDLYTVAALPDPLVREGAQTVGYRRSPGDRLLFAALAGGGVLFAASVVFAGAAARRPDARQRAAAGVLALTRLAARFQLGWRLRIAAVRAAGAAHRRDGRPAAIAAVARRIRDLSLARFF
jgi:hypothetical protein